MVLGEIVVESGPDFLLDCANGHGKRSYFSSQLPVRIILWVRHSNSIFRVPFQPNERFFKLRQRIPTPHLEQIIFGLCPGEGFSVNRADKIKRDKISPLHDIPVLYRHQLRIIILKPA